MRRRIQGLHEANPSGTEIPDSLYLVRVIRAQYRWHAHKPYFLLRFSVLEPLHFAGRNITGRLYCTQKALWKLTWFLRDFGYDRVGMSHDQIDEKSLVGLRGIVKIRRVMISGTSLINLEGLANAAQWGHLSPSAVS